MSVLIVDPDASSRHAAYAAVRWANSKRSVQMADTGTEAMSMAMDARHELIICDPDLPDMPGENLCGQLRERLPRSRFVAYSNDAGAYRKSTRKLSVFQGFLAKPANQLDVLPLVRETRAARSSALAPAVRSDIIETPVGGMPLVQTGRTIHLTVCKIGDEGGLMFRIPLNEGATVESALKQLGKSPICRVVLRRTGRETLATRDTVVLDGDTLLIGH